MSTPISAAAANTVVPVDTVKAWPSITTPTDDGMGEWLIVESLSLLSGLPNKFRRLELELLAFADRFPG